MGWRRLTWRQIWDLWRWLRAPDCGPLARAVAWAAILYGLWPVDLMPGWPPLAWLDDALVFWLAYQVLSWQRERARAGAGREGTGSAGWAR